MCIRDSGLSAILYRRTARSRKELHSTSTQASPAADAEPHIKPLPAKVAVSSPPPAQAESRKELETPMASSVDETPMTSTAVENPMEIEHAIELADIFLTYGRTQDALDVLNNFMPVSYTHLDVYKRQGHKLVFQRSVLHPDGPGAAAQ